jgi:hypothetical protein
MTIVMFVGLMNIYNKHDSVANAFAWTLFSSVMALSMYLGYFRPLSFNKEKGYKNRLPWTITSAQMRFLRSVRGEKYGWFMFLKKYPELGKYWDTSEETARALEEIGISMHTDPVL